jgi:hypothetical protein
MWWVNSVSDVRLARRSEDDVVADSEQDSFGVTNPVANYAMPLADAVVSAEIDRLSEQANKMTRRVSKIEEARNDDKRNARYVRAAVAFTFIIAICGLLFSLVIYNRADQTAKLVEENARILATVQATQARLDATTARLDVSVHESCVLYALLLSQYNAKSRALSPRGPDGYDNDFRKLYASSQHQNCGIGEPPDLVR